MVVVVVAVFVVGTVVVVLTKVPRIVVNIPIAILLVRVREK